MSLTLKRNMPLILALLTVVLVLVIFFGNLRVGATNVHLGTWVELRVAVAVDAADAPSVQPNAADQSVLYLEQPSLPENSN